MNRIYRKRRFFLKSVSLITLGSFIIPNRVFAQDDSLLDSIFEGSKKLARKIFDDEDLEDLTQSETRQLQTNIANQATSLRQAANWRVPQATHFINEWSNGSGGSLKHVRMCPTCNSVAAGMAQGLPCLLYTSPSPRDRTRSRMPSSA